MKKMIEFHNNQIVLNQQLSFLKKSLKKPGKKKKTLNTNGKDEDEEKFPYLSFKKM